MKKKMLKKLVASFMVVMMAGIFVGCGNGTDDKKQVEPGSKTSGSITVAGSTALQPLAEEASKEFKKKYPDATINVQGGGSGVGINQVLEGSIDIGNSDVTAESKLKEGDKVKELADYKVCGIGFAIVVNKDVKVESLTKAQIKQIFTGKVKNWKEVGGLDLAINVVNRPKSSGTRGAFKNTVMDGTEELEGLGTTQDSNGSVKETVKSTSGAISYLALSYLSTDKSEDLKILKIDNIEPTKDNITSKKYPFWSYEYMYTKGEAKGLKKAFIDYVMSDENKEVVEKLGYIPMSSFK